MRNYVIYDAHIDMPYNLCHIWHMHTHEIIGEIKAARARKSLTQEHIARLAGVPLRTYQRLESGDRGSRLDTLLRVLDALGLSLKTVSKRRPSLDELNELYGDE